MADVIENNGEEEEAPKVVAGAESSNASGSEAALSKSQMKKAKRKLLQQERWESTKKERRVAEKTKRKQKKVVEREKLIAENKAAGIEDPNMNIEMTEEEREERRLNRGERKRQEEADYKDQCNVNFGIVIDCKWEDVHDEQGLKSLMKQIVHAYAANRKFSKPSHLYLTGVGPFIYERLLKIGADHWLGATLIKDDDYITLPNFQTVPVPVNVVDVDGESSSNDTTKFKKQLVYLTSDAEEVIDELDPNCAYIIGGIVDRNSLKGITYKKAKEQNIRTVQLPIREHLQMTKTHVLTVNHCVELLLHKGSGASSIHWKDALDTVIPQRKTGSKKRKRGGGNEGKEANEDDDDDDDDTGNDKGSEDGANGNGEACDAIGVVAPDGGAKEANRNTETETETEKEGK